MGARHRAVSMSYTVSADEKERSLKSMARLKTLLKEIKYDWAQVASNEATPLELAIAFLDDTLVGLAHRKPHYDELCEGFGAALRDAVVDNHELFNNSVGLYHLLLNTAQDLQLQAETIGEIFESSTQDIRSRTQLMRELDAGSTKYTETIEILDAMERLAAIPAEVERLIGEKKIHHVYDIIAAGHQTAAKYNLWSLSAMGATQSFLEAQLHTLYDMIVEEVKNEIYLRNVVSVKDAWLFLFLSSSSSSACLTQLLHLASLELSIHNLANVDAGDVAERLGEHTDSFLRKLLPKLHRLSSTGDSSTVNYSILLDSTQNSSLESYFYLYRLLCTASKLNKLDSIVTILATSLRLEILVLISRVTEETKLAHLQRLAKLQKTRAMEQSIAGDRMNVLRLYDTSVPILHDFFFSAFVACLIVLQRHRVACEIVKVIRSKDVVVPGKRDSIVPMPDSQYDFERIWKVVSEELRALVTAYLHENDDDLSSTKGDAPNTSYSTGDSRIHLVLMKRQLFAFEHAEANYAASHVSQELTEAVGEMFPGFQLGKSADASSNHSDVSPYISSEHNASSVHVLVPLSVFNMRIVLEHLLIFVAGSLRLFVGLQPKKTSPAGEFFFDVMNHSFLGRLRDESDHAFAECMIADSRDTRGGFGQLVIAVNVDGGSSANSMLLLPTLSLLSVYSNAVQFRRFFVSLCHTVNTSFTYRREMSGLVLDLLKKFALVYSDYNQDLLTTGGTQDITEIRIGGGTGLQPSKPSSQVNQWMRIPALLQLSGRLLYSLTSADLHLDAEAVATVAALTQEEISLMFPTQVPEKIFGLSKQDLLDDEWFHHVCYLVLSSLWVLSWLPSMRKESNYNVGDLESGLDLENIERLKYEFSFLENGRPSAAILERTQHVYLTLSLGKVVEFDNVVKTFETIRDNALIALRYDIRLKALYHIGQSFQESFVLSTEPADCDPFILLFNKEIYFIGTKVQDLLTPIEAECVFNGLPQFIIEAFLEGSALVKVVNKNGIKKILLNIFTTQQVLRTVMKKENSVDLSKASKYFELFTVNEKLLLDKLTSSKTPYSRREVINLIRLIYSERMSSATVSLFNKTMYADIMAKVKDVFKQ